ncbi:TPA: hypothetical protein EYP84_03375 [Candidatus Bipolaricaulota bacterium]|nr:hypothetical protein [Candidatus Bipolaricaulota bacterium]
MARAQAWREAMPISYAQEVSLTCPRCRTAFTARVWLVVDAGERPDLLERAREGRLHTVTCPHCGHEREVDAPVLVFRPHPLPFSFWERGRGCCRGRRGWG